MYGVLLAVLWLSDLNHLPEFPYQQLPSEQMCATMNKVCEDDICRISYTLDVLGNGYANETILRRHEGMLTEAYRVRKVWEVAWWVVWVEPIPRGGYDPYYPSTHGRMCPDAREEWAEQLILLIGADAFHRGEMPLPLSMRR
jgi:hypothetical protein